MICKKSILNSGWYHEVYDDLIPPTQKNQDATAPYLVPGTDLSRLFASIRPGVAPGAWHRFGPTVWGGINEQARKLALLYAISENHINPTIGTDAANWASTLIMHQTRRMLFMAGSHVAENPYHADCLRLIRKLQAAPDRTLTHSVLLKRMKMNARCFKKSSRPLSSKETLC
jgi:hypothetical protein